MNGLECLKAELINRGFTKQQTESKVVAGVLDVLASSNGEYADMHRIMDEVKLLQERKDNLYRYCLELERKRDALRNEYEQIMKDVNDTIDKRYNSTIEYIDRFLNSINECETAQAKDALKTAQMFVNSCEVDTKYDNTAFIIGLAAILSHGNVAPIDQLRKINKKIPEIKFVANIGAKYGYDMKEYGVDVWPSRIEHEF